MNIIRNLLYIIIFYCVFSYSDSSAANNHTISATVEVSETAINRYLNNQYNSTGFPRSFMYNYGGTNYTIALALPEIILTPGNAALRMIFDVNTGTTNVYHFEVDPSINIPSGQITAAQVQAYLSNLEATLNAISFIPQWVRDQITTYYNSLGYLVYPSKLIDQVNSSFFSQHRVNVESPYFALGWQVSQGVLSLVVSTYLSSQGPLFWVALADPSSGNDQSIFLTNIEVNVKELFVVSLGGTVRYHGIPNTVCPKGGTAAIDIGLLNLGTFNTYIVRAVFTIDNTWFAAEYGSVVVNTGSYYGATLKENY